jgi:hypothetical protein
MTYRLQSVLKSLIVMIAVMFTTAALAQEQCRSISEIHRGLDRIVDRVETVPPDEANYIRTEKAKALEQQNPNRFGALYHRHFYAATEFHDDAAVVMQNVEAAEHAAAAKDIARYLIVVLSRLSDLKTSMNDFIEADGTRQQATLSKEDKQTMQYMILAVKSQTTIILQCVVKGL